MEKCELRTIENGYILKYRKSGVLGDVERQFSHLQQVFQYLQDELEPQYRNHPKKIVRVEKFEVQKENEINVKVEIDTEKLIKFSIL